LTINRTSYIIERYDSLPGNVIFHHAERFQWHNDDPDYDALALLQRFRFENLRQKGYVNLRCIWDLGCPFEISPDADDNPGVPGEPVHAKHVYKASFQELFPLMKVPSRVGVPCCSQFAVRRENIQRRSRGEYMRFREWLMSSPLGDDISGRVLEYSWHSKYKHTSFFFSRLSHDLFTLFSSHVRQRRRQLPHGQQLLLRDVRPVRPRMHLQQV
jgi:hypothetical protein